MTAVTLRRVNSTIETLDDNKVKVSVDVAEEELEGAIDAAFRKIAKEVRLPGFRPGKVPRKVLEARFGKDVARGEALRDAIPEFYVQAVREHEVDVIAPPDLEITDGEDAGPVRFEAVVETRPLVAITGYDALTVEIPSPDVEDADIDEQLDNMRGQFGELSAVERPAVDGDHVTIDISATHDGEDVPGLTADDYVYELGSGAVVEEIDEELRGAKVGDILTFDADHPDPDTEGSLSFRVLVKEVSEKVLPELDDEFAAQASEFDTVAELVADTRDKLATAKRRRAAAAADEGLAAKIAELVTEPVPDALIDAEVQQRLQDLVMRLRSQGIDPNQYFQMTGQTPDQLAATLREPAEVGVRLDLALRAVARAEELEATDDDLREEFEAMATQLGDDVDIDAVREQFDTSGTTFEVRAELAKRKAREWISDRVTLVDSDGNEIDRAVLEEPEPVPDDESGEPTASDTDAEAEVAEDDVDEPAADEEE